MERSSVGRDEGFRGGSALCGQSAVLWKRPTHPPPTAIRIIKRSPRATRRSEPELRCEVQIVTIGRGVVAGRVTPSGIILPPPGEEGLGSTMIDDRGSPGPRAQVRRARVINMYPLAGTRRSSLESAQTNG